MLLLLLLLLLALAPSECAAVVPVNVSVPEQYATVLAWDQYVPTLAVPSTFVGLLYLTVTPLNMAPGNLSANTYRVDTYLYHNIPFALVLAVYGPAARGAHNGSVLLFHLNDPSTDPGSAGCPQTVSVVISERVVTWLRQGLLYAQIDSNGAGGELRGQIETRNDLYFCALGDPAANASYTGAVVVRGYTVSISGVRQTLPSQPLGVDYWLLSATEASRGFAAGFPSTEIANFDFGVLPSNVEFVNMLYGIGLYAVRRDYIERTGTVYGPGSSSMQIYAQAFLADDNYTFFFDPLCEMVRLPLLGFPYGLGSNNFVIFKPLY
jgi:hypothetical protein